MNTWEDANVIKSGQRHRQGARLVFAGMWTSGVHRRPGPVGYFGQGYETFVIADACGDVSVEAHDRAMDRMVQAPRIVRDR